MKPAKAVRKPKKATAEPSARKAERRSAGGKGFPRTKLAITHRVVQRLELDVAGLRAEDMESALETHREPDIYVNDESFPGEMMWRVVEQTTTPTTGKRKALSLMRTIDFTFDLPRY